MIIEITFWLAAGLVAYAWLGYPLLLTALAAISSPSVRALRPRPRLSVIIAAYNEARTIKAKLASTCSQQYPRDRIEVIVVSDGSTDGTDDIVRRYPDRRVLLVRQEPRSGKSVALNRGVAVATGDVLVFTDANALFGTDALARLAALFADPRVGLVSGQGLYGETGAADAGAVSNGYVRYEAWLRRGESALGFLANADGAIYALRRHLYRPLGRAEVNDLLHPIQATLAGFDSRFDDHAFTIEPPSGHAGQEWRRHVRIIAQGMELLAAWTPRLVAAGCWRALWALVSHRVLRWATAPLLAAALVTNIVLAWRMPLYTITLAAQLAFYVMALAGPIAERLGRRLGVFGAPYYFCVVSVAGVAGFLRALRGGADAIWTPGGQAISRDRAA
ncbi:MAG TPA: glycosyltransferase [Methylomirabilota bacterium]